MKAYKKIIALAAAVAMMSSTLSSKIAYTGETVIKNIATAPALAPAIALGAIALAAIIAVAVQNGSNDHGHCH